MLAETEKSNLLFAVRMFAGTLFLENGCNFMEANILQSKTSEGIAASSAVFDAGKRQVVGQPWHNISHASIFDMCRQAIEKSCASSHITTGWKVIFTLRFAVNPPYHTDRQYEYENINYRSNR